MNNTFHRNSENHLNIEKESDILEQYAINISMDWGKTVKKKEENGYTSKGAVFRPSAVMLRNLLEGTSFDRRTNKIDNEIFEDEKKPVESELNIATNKSNTTEKYFKNKPKKRTHDTRIVKKKRTSYSTTPKKKKFITEKEQNRLKHVVKILFEPPKE